MRIDLYVHQADDPQNPVLRRDDLNAAMQLLEKIMTDFGDKLDRLESVVAKEDTVEASFIAFSNGLVDQIRSLKDQLASAGVPADQVARLEALASHVEQRTSTMAAAMTANTDTPPAPPADAAPAATTTDAQPAEATADATREPPNDGASN